MSVGKISDNWNVNADFACIECIVIKIYFVIYEYILMC